MFCNIKTMSNKHQNETTMKTKMENQEIKFFNEQVGSSIYAYEVIKQLTPTRYLVRELDWEVINQYGDCGNYRSNEENECIVISRRKNGTYRQMGKDWSGHFFAAEKPSAYRDLGF